MTARVKPIRIGVWNDQQHDPVRALENRLEALRAADDAGRETGFRMGYIAGWRYGVICGAMPGILLGAALVAGAIKLGLMAAHL